MKQLAYIGKEVQAKPLKRVILTFERMSNLKIKVSNNNSAA